jgi:DNA-binding transcriptional ArsR family regulator
MTRFTHPNLNDVPLASVLHALSDPTRLAIVRRLNDDLGAKGEGLACNCAVAEERGGRRPLPGIARCGAERGDGLSKS